MLCNQSSSKLASVLLSKAFGLLAVLCVASPFVFCDCLAVLSAGAFDAHKPYVSIMISGNKRNVIQMSVR